MIFRTRFARFSIEGNARVHMAEKKFSVDFKKLIVGLYDAGTSVNKLQAEYGILKAKIYNWKKLYQ